MSRVVTASSSWPASMVSGIWVSSPLIIVVFTVNYRLTRFTEDKHQPFSALPRPNFFHHLFVFLMWTKNWIAYKTIQWNFPVNESLEMGLD